MLDILIYDAEIANPIASKKEAKREGYLYAASWEDYEGMGVAVVGTYSYKSGLYRAFWADELNELQRAFNNHKLLVGFNNLSFDNKLLAAHGLVLEREKIYDIYVEVKKAAGAGKFAKGYKLSDIASANGLTNKTGSGADAPFMWQDGKRSEVAAYCLQDVKVTVEVLDTIISNDLLNPIGGEPLAVMSPVQWE